MIRGGSASDRLLSQQEIFNQRTPGLRAGGCAMTQIPNYEGKPNIRCIEITNQSLYRSAVWNSIGITCVYCYLSVVSIGREPVDNFFTSPIGNQDLLSNSPKSYLWITLCKVAGEGLITIEEVIFGTSGMKLFRLVEQYVNIWQFKPTECSLTSV